MGRAAASSTRPTIPPGTRDLYRLCLRLALTADSTTRRVVSRLVPLAVWAVTVILAASRLCPASRTFPARESATTDEALAPAAMVVVLVPSTTVLVTLRPRRFVVVSITLSRTVTVQLAPPAAQLIGTVTVLLPGLAAGLPIVLTPVPAAAVVAGVVAGGVEAGAALTVTTNVGDTEPAKSSSPR